jgi:hypothetical protein
LEFGVHLEGKVYCKWNWDVKIITGCSRICIRHCGKTLIGNIESILDFVMYRNVGRCTCSGSNEL